MATTAMTPEEKAEQRTKILVYGGLILGTVLIVIFVKMLDAGKFDKFFKEYVPKT